MTEAMHLIVKAMCEEFVRQAQEDRVNSGYAAPITTRPHEITLDGVFNLEKVARAGLLAIREPPRQVFVALDSTIDAGIGVAEGWSAGIDELLK